MGHNSCILRDRAVNSSNILGFSMSFDLVKCPDMIVATGTGLSPVVKAREVYADARTIVLYAPTSATAGTIECTDDPDAAAPTFYTLQDRPLGGALADVPLPLAGKVAEFAIPAQGFRLHMTAAPGAPLTFKVFKRVELSGVMAGSY